MKMLEVIVSNALMSSKRMFMVFCNVYNYMEPTISINIIKTGIA